MNETIFSSLKSHWDRLLQEGQKVSFRKGQVLFYEGHSPYGIFVVKSGKVRFSRGDHPCTLDHFWQSPRGKVIGVDHFPETPFCCTCTAVNDCQMLFISKTQLAPCLPEKA